jgi:hypothetical protein
MLLAWIIPCYNKTASDVVVATYYKLRIVELSKKELINYEMSETSFSGNYTASF